MVLIGSFSNFTIHSDYVRNICKFKVIKVVTTYYYKCDGGINPTHHHPTTVKVTQVEQFQVKLNGNKYGTLSEAEEELCKDYDRVTLIHIKTAYHQQHERVVKWEQTK